MGKDKPVGDILSCDLQSFHSFWKDRDCATTFRTGSKKITLPLINPLVTTVTFKSFSYFLWYDYFRHLTVGKFIQDLVIENYGLKLVLGFEVRITRGLGEIQKKERTFTCYRIIAPLYTQPHTYQQLWKATKIHKNTFTQRLDELINDNIIIKHHYTFSNYRGKYTGRDFYLLNWAKKQSKEMVSSLSRIMPLMNYYLSGISYAINSIQVEPSKREYTIIRQGRLHFPYEYISYIEFKKKVGELCEKENDIFEQISTHIEAGAIPKLPVGEINELIDKRDSVLELLIILYTRYWVNTYLPSINKYRVKNDYDLDPYDMLVLFATTGLFDYSRPYVKFWEIMQRIALVLNHLWLCNK